MGSRFSVHNLLLSFYIAIASALSLPATILENGTALSMAVNLTGPISPIPPGPPGFSVDYLWDRYRLLNPLGVYVTAIKLMYGLSLQPWSSPVELLESGLCIVTQQPDYDIIIITSDNPPGTELTTFLAAKVLYECVTDMATQEPGFYHISGFINIDTRRIGKMFIDSSGRPRYDENGANGSSTANSPPCNASPNGLELPAPNITQLLNSREIIDPSDRRFKITWDWDGKNIPAQDIFSSAFNGLAAVAQYDFDGACDFITALSTSGGAVFHIGRTTTTKGLSGGQIGRAFYLLIFQLFLVQKKFQEMWLYLSYDGASIADGYIHKVKRVGGVNSTIEGIASE